MKKMMTLVFCTGFLFLFLLSFVTAADSTMTLSQALVRQSNLTTTYLYQEGKSYISIKTFDREGDDPDFWNYVLTDLQSGSEENHYSATLQKNISVYDISETYLNLQTFETFVYIENAEEIVLAKSYTYNDGSKTESRITYQLNYFITEIPPDIFNVDVLQIEFSINDVTDIHQSYPVRVLQTDILLQIKIDFELVGNNDLEIDTSSSTTTLLIIEDLFPWSPFIIAIVAITIPILIFIYLTKIKR